MPLLGQLPPLPPPLPPSPQLLRRAVSDPAPLKMPISESKVNEFLPSVFGSSFLHFLGFWVLNFFRFQGAKKVGKNSGKMNQVFDEIANDKYVHGSAPKQGRNYTRACSNRVHLSSSESLELCVS